MPADNHQIALGAHGITKRFPGVLANNQLDFEVRPGEVHALLGENGSGKTTLCKILTGFYRPDAGQVTVRDRQVNLRSPADAYNEGIFMVHQHFSLVERLSVAENVVLGWSRKRKFRLDRRRMIDEVRAAADRLQIQIDPEAPVWQLSVGERQRVEILKGLYRGAKTLILDEPTTVLTPQEIDELFVSLRRMADDGEAVVFISHKLQEVLAVCDRVTVLRHGESIGTVELSNADEPVDTGVLARMMVGREIHFTRRERSSRQDGVEPVLSIRDASADNDFGRQVLENVSLDVAPGEIVGVAGVAGNGQRQLAEVITGLRPLTTGTVIVGGKALRSGNPRAALEHGIAYVPEDRMGVGLAAGLTIEDNVALRSFRSSQFSRGPFVRRSKIRERTGRLLKSFDIKGHAHTTVRQLSGGNAQKVLLAREISSEPRLLVVAAPTRGLDVSAMENVRQLILSAAAERGMGVLMISESLEEILDLADRIAVMCRGRITGVLDADNADTERLGLLMMGQEAP